MSRRDARFLNCASLLSPGMFAVRLPALYCIGVSVMLNLFEGGLVSISFCLPFNFVVDCVLVG